ncbi:IclR family transcriptional regulator [Natrinema gelatinilyticum]|uniref:IclR family transcriptional regulator n=1 Tax=Natrinema gelatinilyticum TaxID=2961571 RepID=UPI0020C4AB8A|nr:IclR family transcriptional regulator [Natrinema gelatinilyticum]
MSSDERAGKAPRTVQAVETAFEILAYLETHGQSGVTELADALGTSKSAVHRHLATLVEADRVTNVDGTYRPTTQNVRGVGPVFEIIETLNEMDSATPEEVAASTDRSVSAVTAYLDRLEELAYVVEQDGTYRNGLKYLDIGERVKYNTGIFDIVAEEVDKLAAESGELALFSVIEHGQNVLLYKAHGEDAIQTTHEIGLREPMHISGLGKAILAELSDERVRRIVDRHGLASFTEHTITDREALFDSLGDIRERGYALDMEEAKPGLRCVAASVSCESGPLHGAVSIAAPKSRMQGDRLERQIPELVKGAANVIELNSIYVE